MKMLKLKTLLVVGLLSAGIVDAADIKPTINPTPVKYQLMEVIENAKSIFSISGDGTIRGMNGRFIGKLTKEERDALERIFKSRI